MPDGSGKKDIKALLPDELTAELAALGLPGYRAGQVFRWLARGAAGFGDMSDLPKALRERLDAAYTIPSLSLLRRQVSARDGTEKFLWRLPDGESVETVLMRYKHGNTVCISSQVGARVDGVVLMGIGEPLDNFDNVMRFLRLVNDPAGANIGMRHISLSTCGLVDAIDKLASLHLQLTLSVSLHAPDDETRSRLMPVNAAWGVDELYAACERYFAVTGRRVSFEYAMVRDVNDTPRHADLLLRRLRGTGSHVNLIRLNYVSERGLPPSSEETVRAFAKRLNDGGVRATVRRRLGSDIDAACGQLRRGEMRKP